MNDVLNRLLSLRDPDNAAFQSKLAPGINADRFLGVRTPEIRKLGKALQNTPEAAAFMDALPHFYFDENNLHAVLIEGIKDFESCVASLDRFLPFVDNWATCDIMSPKCFKKHLPELLSHIRRWMNSTHPYTCRFGIGMLLRWYLDDAFDPQYLDWVAALRSEEYYVNMMIAWYFATALAKQYNAALPYLQNKKLAPWTHNKAIQKAIESYRVTPEQKEALRGLKIR
ncbi:MAG: DNA alkylation repair protein [Clostridia bacterium]|nr:DNA alkylation repair protein [Clostridia bacterium]